MAHKKAGPPKKKGLLGPQKVIVKNSAASKLAGGAVSAAAAVQPAGQKGRQTQANGSKASKKQPNPHTNGARGKGADARQQSKGGHGKGSGGSSKAPQGPLAEARKQPTTNNAHKQGAAAANAGSRKAVTGKGSAEGRAQGGRGAAGKAALPGAKPAGKKPGTLFSAAPAVCAGQGASGGVRSRAAAHDKRSASRGKGGDGKAALKVTGGVTKARAGKGKRRGKAGKAAKPSAASLETLIPELTTPADAAAAAAAAAPPAGVNGARMSNWELMKDRVARSNAAAAGEQGDGAPKAAAKARHFDRMRKQRRDAKLTKAAAAAAAVTRDGVENGKLVPKGPDTSHTRVVAMDCEMINDFGNVLLDLFVKPKEKVTDFRTQYSGIRPADLVNAAPLEDAMQRVHDLLKGHVLVGHALHNDFKVLMLQGVVPPRDLRDTAVYEPLMTTPPEGRKLRSRALKSLAREHLGVDIQAGEHSPVEDSRAVLYIYHKHKAAWEAALKAGTIKPRTLKSAGKIATGARHAKAPRATAISAARPPPGLADDDEFAPPTLGSVALMRARMADTAQDIYADL